MVDDGCYGKTQIGVKGYHIKEALGLLMLYNSNERYFGSGPQKRFLLPRFSIRLVLKDT